MLNLFRKNVVEIRRTRLWICTTLTIMLSIYCLSFRVYAEGKLADEKVMAGDALLVHTKLIEVSGREIPVILNVSIQRMPLRQRNDNSLEKTGTGYMLEAFDAAGQLVASLSVHYLRILDVPPAIEYQEEDREQEIQQVKVEQPEAVVILPYDSKMSFINISDHEGSLPSATVSLDDIARGEEGLTKAASPFPSQMGKFNVLIMASGYTASSMAQFNAQALASKNELLSIEPFFSYRDDTVINLYENTSDLGCRCGCYDIDRLMCCDLLQVIAAAAQSGYFFDEIIVIHNTQVYCGGGYRDYGSYQTDSYSSYAMAYDGYWTTNLIVHEFGHSFGNLCDEYTYGDVGDIYEYSYCVNCRPTCTDWSEITWACNEGCDCEPSYFRPGESIMFDLGVEFYNDVSIQQSLIPRLTYFIGQDIESNISSGNITLNHHWTTLSFGEEHIDPIIIAGPPTYHGTDPGVIRVRSITNSTFDARFQEWLYKDGSHTTENIPYLALSSDRYQMPNGSIWEADSFSLSGTGAWAAQSFSGSFPSTPALFLTAQTYNGPDPIAVRARNVTNTGFEAALFEEENKMDGHATEVVGYLAVYSPQLSGTVNINGTDVPYLLQAQSVDHRFVPVLSSDIKLEEEKSKDSEIGHINETVSILALGDKIFTQDISTNGGDTIAIRRLSPEYNTIMEWGTVDGVDHNWMKVPLAKEYINPVVVAKPVSSYGGDPGVIRIRNVSHNSFELRYNEWAYLDGWHTQERVFYMVAEAGERSVAGLTVEAGILNTSKLLADGWEPITFSALFSQAPSVFTSVQTYNGADPVTTRLRECTAAGFDLTMDEEEAKNDGHTTEKIGWIAIEKGTGNTNDNRSVVVLSSSTSHIPTQINFGQSMARRFPVIISDMITTNGSDPCFLRYQHLLPGSIDLFIQEEASVDAEMNHIVEDVSVFVGE